MEEQEIKSELAAIRGLMERSSKFISLSGLSGILAGIYALVGAAVAYKLIEDDPLHRSLETLSRKVLGNADSAGLFYGGNKSILEVKLFITALIVLIASILTGYVLSARKAKQKGQAIWGQTSRLLLFNMAIPLVAGGLLMLIMLLRGHFGIISSTSLIFYGLALVSAGNYTFTDVKYLGLCEIVLGLIAACVPGYGLLFWAVGFGVLHIVYGGMMYFKYDR